VLTSLVKRAKAVLFSQGLWTPLLVEARLFEARVEVVVVPRVLRDHPRTPSGFLSSRTLPLMGPHAPQRHLVSCPTPCCETCECVRRGHPRLDSALLKTSARTMDTGSASRFDALSTTSRPLPRPHNSSTNTYKSAQARQKWSCQHPSHASFPCPQLSRHRGNNCYSAEEMLNLNH